MKNLKLFLSCLLMVCISIAQVWADDVIVPTSGSKYRIKAVKTGTGAGTYYMVAPTASGLGGATTTEINGTVFTFTQEESKWYVTFTDGEKTYHMSEHKDNGKVNISTEKMEVAIGTNDKFIKIGSTKWIQFNYNSGNCRMGCYSSSQTGVVLSEVSDIQVPTIISNPTTVAFGKKNIFFEAQKTGDLTLSILGVGLTDDITVTLSGTNADKFSLSESSLTPTAGALKADLTVSYAVTEIGEYAATLTLSSIGAEDVVLPISLLVVNNKPTVYTRVISSDDLNAGDKIIIANETYNKAAGAISSSLLSAINVEEVLDTDNGMLYITDEAVQVFTLGGAQGAWILTSDAGQLSSVEAKKMIADGTTTWGITIDEGNAAPYVSEEVGTLQYNDNNGNGRFTTYTSVQKPVQFYSIPDPGVKFRVAGSSLALFYRIWEASHPHGYTDMKRQDNGLYTLVRDGITLPAGEVKYQVVKNDDFAYSWPADTAVLVVPEDGIYDVTFTFNPGNRAVSASLDKVGDVTIVNPVYLKGSWDDWTSALLVPQGDYNDKVVTWLPLTAGDYTFKMLDKNGNSYGDGEVFSRDDASHLKMTLGEGEELVLHADVDGDYIFTYVFESQRLFITYPTIVPETKIAALGGKFTINSAGDTVQFARGNLLYNFGENAWFTAEDQAYSLGDANLRFGDPTFEGTIDMFGWSSEESNFGLLLSNDNADYENSNFVDWGTKFGSGNEWTTLSKSEWNYILARTENGRKLWTHAAIQYGTDTVYALLLFPNKWVAPAGLAIQYGYHPEDEIWEIAENNFFLADQWTLLEEAGTVLMPFAGRRTGFWLNRNNGYGDIWSKTVNPLMPNDSAYCWVDNANGMGYYWLSTPEGNAYQVATIILPGWHNDKWLAPTIWDEYKRRGHTVRLVKRTPAGGSTAVENAQTTESVTKTIENGVLFIHRGGKTFNGQGQLIK